MPVILQEDGTQVWLPSAPRSQPFPIKKTTANGARVFCLGGSSVYGDKVTPNEAFPRLLEKELAQLLTGRNVEVINAGRNGGTLAQAGQFVEIAAGCDVDLVVLYGGHNEYFHHPFRVLKGGEASAGAPSHSLAVVRLLRRFAARPSARRAQARLRMAPDETVADTIEAFREDDKAVLGGVRTTLNRTLGAARAAGLEMVVCSLASNLRACPPFKSMHRRPLSHRLHLAFNANYANGVEGIRRMHDEFLDPASASKARETADFFERALDIDPTYAALRFRLGECYFALKLYDQARAEFEAARELDSAPRRARRAANDVIRRLAKQYGFPLFDLEGVLRDADPNGIPGRELFFDEVHFTPEGHRIVAQALATFIVERGLLKGK